MTEQRLCARSGCGTSLSSMRRDAVWCSRACAMAAKREASPHGGRTGATQRTRILSMLDAAGSRGIHTFEMRRAFIGNPSQRIAELEAAGYVFTRARERLNGQAFGVRYRLIGVEREAA